MRCDDYISEEGRESDETHSARYHRTSCHILNIIDESFRVVSNWKIRDNLIQQFIWERRDGTGCLTTNSEHSSWMIEVQVGRRSLLLGKKDLLVGWITT